MQQGPRPVHRTTEWRRLKRWEETQGQRANPAGRRERDSREQSYIEFAGAVISLVNEKGYCAYGDIFPAHKPGFGFHYFPSPPQLLKTLYSSPYPPALIAVAICDLVPLNHKTRTGTQKLTILERADIAAGSKKNDASIHLRESRRVKLRAVLKQKDYNPELIRTYEAEAERSNFEDEWVRIFLTEYQSQEDRIFKGEPITTGLKTEEIDSSEIVDLVKPQKGTPAHRAGIKGVNLSRRMVCYWKKHRRFVACKGFLRRLFTRSVPKRPHAENISMISREINKSFHEHIKRGWHKIKAQSKTTPAPRQSKPRRDNS